MDRKRASHEQSVIRMDHSLRLHPDSIPHSSRWERGEPNCAAGDERGPGESTGSQSQQEVNRWGRNIGEVIPIVCLLQPLKGCKRKMVGIIEVYRGRVAILTPALMPQARIPESVSDLGILVVFAHLHSKSCYNLNNKE